MLHAVKRTSQNSVSEQRHAAPAACTAHERREARATSRLGLNHPASRPRTSVRLNVSSASLFIHVHIASRYSSELGLFGFVCLVHASRHERTEALRLRSPIVSAESHRVGSVTTSMKVSGPGQVSLHSRGAPNRRGQEPIRPRWNTTQVTLSSRGCETCNLLDPEWRCVG